MGSCLIGHTGFVGGNLHRQRSFDALFRSTDIHTIEPHYDLVVCAGINAVKWKANQDPAADRAGIASLESALRGVTADRFVLISTVDVYPSVHDVDESTDPHAAPNHAYGAHRLAFEDFVRDRFPRHHVIRLPGLYGPGLKKNVLYDLLHDHRCAFIDPAARFQWYDVRRLWADVERVIAAGLPLVNLVPEPVATGAIVPGLFDDRVLAEPSEAPWEYRIRTRHADLFGGRDGWIATADDVLRGIRGWVRTAR